ncbi:SlyX family protein [Marinobacter confluentis]|uniref:Protein SlyX homolog n=1 Tax=Marinobacter confluentis TaxID=1697557 RepID=A0A4Z1CH29_9GAMM|nr:SlyX family protein [Marinobacter confluentis]TGN39832.1 SlyX family protein [Marinobacter confluentis]
MSTANNANSRRDSSGELARRLDELETRVAFQDDLINTLSEQVARQELDIRELWEAKKHLNNQLKEVSSSNIRKEEDEAPPPHY